MVTFFAYSNSHTQSVYEIQIQIIQINATALYVRSLYKKSRNLKKKNETFLM